MSTSYRCVMMACSVSRSHIDLLAMKRGLGANLTIPHWENEVAQRVLHHAHPRDAFDTFNMGLGWVAIVAPEDADAAVKCGKGASIIGEMDGSGEVRVAIRK